MADELIFGRRFPITHFKPCSLGYAYFKRHKTTMDAWDNCVRGDWMLWFATKIKTNARLLYRVKVEALQRHEHNYIKTFKAIHNAFIYARENLAGTIDLYRPAMDQTQHIYHLYIQDGKKHTLKMYQVYSAVTMLMLNPYQEEQNDFGAVARIMTTNRPTVDLCKKHLSQEIEKKVKRYEKWAYPMEERR